MRQKVIKIIVFLLLFLIFSSFLQGGNVTFAKSKNDGEKQLIDKTNEEIDNLDLDGLEQYFDSLGNDEKLLLSDDFKGFLKDVLAGKNNLSFEDFLKTFFNLLLKSFLDFIPALLSVIIIALMYGVLNGLNSGFLNESTNKIVYFTCYCSAMAIVMNEVLSLLNLTSLTVTKIGSFMQVLFPVMLTLMTALGGLSTVGFVKPLMTILSTFIVGLFSSLILPCFIASLILSVVGNLSSVVKLNKLSIFFRKVAEWSMIIIFGAFISLLTMRGIVGATTDGIAVNAAKFTISSFVPVVGGYISDGFDVAIAGCILIKNALGVTGLIVLLSIILMPICKLAIFHISLKLASAVTEPTGAEKISDLLNSLSNCIKLLIATLCGVSFMLFSMIMLSVTSLNLGVV